MEKEPTECQGDAASDHHLVVAEVKTKLKAYNDRAGRTSHKFNVHCLKEREKAVEFKVELKNKFGVLSRLPEETVEEQGTAYKKSGR